MPPVSRHNFGLCLGAVLAALLVALTDWIWAGLYHQQYAVSELIFAFLIVCVGAIASITIFRLFMVRSATYRIANFFLVTFVAFFLFKLVHQLGAFTVGLSGAQKALLVIASLTVAAFFALRLSDETWGRLHSAFIFAALAFVLSPLAYSAYAAQRIYWPNLSAQGREAYTSNLSTQATLILLLDELSASATAPIVRGLRDAGLVVTEAAIDPIGKNTLNVTPAMWLHADFGKAKVCGPTQVCSERAVLNFARVSALSPNIDVVGFYNPYCAMNGLRSCYVAPLPKRVTVLEEMTCALMRWSTVVPATCSTLPASARSEHEAMRNDLRQMVLNRPFWEHGGILFAHLYEPHPLIGRPVQSFAEEYNDNIVNSAAFVSMIARKARLRFGNDFRIIVFSDHPLRPKTWCDDKIRSATDCLPSASQTSTQVPLIIASPSDTAKMPIAPKTNMHVFDSLFERR